MKNNVFREQMHFGTSVHFDPDAWQNFSELSGNLYKATLRYMSDNA
jgi:hypothetical protein